jgi:hypothetical protein
LSTLIEILNDKIGQHDIDVGKIRPSLFDMFEDDASPKVKTFFKVLVTKLQSCDNECGSLGAIGNLTQKFMKQKLDRSDKGSKYVKSALQEEISSTQEVYVRSRKRGRENKNSIDRGVGTIMMKYLIFIVCVMARTHMKQRHVGSHGRRLKTCMNTRKEMVNLLNLLNFLFLIAILA